MKIKIFTMLLASLASMLVVYAGKVSATDSEIGDRYILAASGDFTFTKPAEFDLSPINAPDNNAVYGIRCRVVYCNNEIKCPKTEEDFAIANCARKILSGWLKEFIAERCSEADFQELLEAYVAGDFAENLNEDFKNYVKDQNEKLSSGERLDVEIGMVEVVSVDAFEAALLAYRGE